MNQNTLNAWDALKATALWWSPVLAGFIGAFGTHLLTQSREREKWILDTKKQEYKELLSALSDCYVSYILFVNSGIEGPSASDTKQYKESIMALTRVVRDRIFIVEDFDLGEFLVLWGKVTSYFEENRNVDSFTRDYKILNAFIVKLAVHGTPKTAWRRLLLWKHGPIKQEPLPLQRRTVK
jgi:hypothetical protein